jgi:hypothetical protein
MTAVAARVDGPPRERLSARRDTTTLAVFGTARSSTAPPSECGTCTWAWPC